MTKGVQAKWQLIKFSLRDSLLINPCVAAISATEIAIFGGYNQKMNIPGDGYIFDSTKLSIKKVMDNKDLNFSSI